MNDFFGKLGAICGRHNLISKPMQVYNCDETGVSFVHRPGKVATEVGRRNAYTAIYKHVHLEKRVRPTPFFWCSASGYISPQ